MCSSRTSASSATIAPSSIRSSAPPRTASSSSVCATSAWTRPRARRRSARRAEPAPISTARSAMAKGSRADEPIQALLKEGRKFAPPKEFTRRARVTSARIYQEAKRRVSTMEVESALVEHPSVAEAAVIGRTHEIKGQAIAAFVTIKEGRPQTPELIDEIKSHVAKKIGALARPDDIIYSAELPKTRSGKIMRRLLRDIAEGRALGDTTTLADPNVVATLKTRYEDEGKE
ncbi:MAG: hypothetical protein HYU41_06660 [Candidatus Rokubacteria bacterium]|nr:hypothetical protein [Candidatus Rokubacteria bacterium]